MKLIFGLFSLFGLCYIINKYIVYYNYSSKESCTITYKPIITNEEYNKKIEKGYQELDELDPWTAQHPTGGSEWILDHPDTLSLCVDKCRNTFRDLQSIDGMNCLKECRMDFG